MYYLDDALKVYPDKLISVLVHRTKRFHQTGRHVLISDDFDQRKNIFILKTRLTQSLNIIGRTGINRPGDFGCHISYQPFPCIKICFGVININLFG